jgi:hypothetical protein
VGGRPKQRSFAAAGQHPDHEYVNRAFAVIANPEGGVAIQLLDCFVPAGRAQ